MTQSQQPASERGFLKPYGKGAVVLAVLGVLCLLVELQSSSLVYWTGQRVVGTNDAGIIYYEVNDQQRTINDEAEPPAQPQSVTVYADLNDSTKDRIAEPVKWFDAVFVAIPFLAAGVVIAIGMARRRKFRLRAVSTPPLPPVRSSRRGTQDSAARSS